MLHLALIWAATTALTAPSPVSTVDFYSRLSKWIESNGGNSNVLLDTCEETGLRGLVVADRSCNVGDVLLEVPLSLVIADGEAGKTPLENSSPSWSWELPWNVQLALAALQRQTTPRTLDGGDDDNDDGEDPFLASWPSEPPPLPASLEAAELALASDHELATKADEAFFWVSEQYWAARDAAAAHDAFPGGFPTEEAFRASMELVFSRCLRLSTGEETGVRRCLVPLLDLANHDAVPSAMYAYASNARCGPAIRLHAARPLSPGEAVTITYGEHSSTHFALYYGFVPQPNPHDALTVTLPDVLSSLPPASLGDPPAEGWAEKIERLGWGGTAFRLYPSAPSGDLLQALAALLPAQSSGGTDAAAARAVATTAAAIERALWGINDAAEAEAAIAADVALLAPPPAEASESNPASASASLSPRCRVLVDLRLSRRRLLASLRRSMTDAARACDEDAAGGAAALTALAAAAEPPPLYPCFDELPLEELTSWASRAWDWEAGAWEAEPAS